MQVVKITQRRDGHLTSEIVHSEPEEAPDAGEPVPSLPSEPSPPSEPDQSVPEPQE